MAKRPNLTATADASVAANQNSVTAGPSLYDELLATVPSLRAFAVSLCRNVDQADDLVQEILVRALSHIDSFKPGTNMAAWLFAILRNLLRSECRRRWREVEDAEGQHAKTLKSNPEQSGRLEFSEFRAALAKLPTNQQRALILVGAAGFSHDDAAVICDCPPGTIKSRIHRARARLVDLLEIEGGDYFGPDRTTRSVMSGSQESTRDLQRHDAVYEASTLL